MRVGETIEDLFLGPKEQVYEKLRRGLLRRYLVLIGAMKVEKERSEELDGLEEKLQGLCGGIEHSEIVVQSRETTLIEGVD